MTVAEQRNMSDFDKLVEQLKNQFPEDSSVILDTKDIDHELLLSILKQYESVESDWTRFALKNGSRSYTRNGVEDFGPNANLLILVWSPGKSSVIHDHSNAHCCMKILKGELKESLYHAKTADDVDDETPPELFRETILGENATAYIHDRLGVHKISNPSDTDFAVSLHLYTPPYAKLKGFNYYESSSGKRHHCDMSKLYSWRGELIK